MRRAQVPGSVLRRVLRRPSVLILPELLALYKKEVKLKIKLINNCLSVEGMPLGKYLVNFAKNELFTYSGDLLLNSAIFH